MSRQQRIARNTLLALLGVAGAGVVRLVFTLATGRAFGVAVLGDIAVILAVATIATIPAAGVGAAGARFLAVAAGADDDSLRSSTLGATWRGAVLVTGAAVGASWIYLRVQATPNIDTTTVALGLVFVAAYGLYLTSKGVLFGDGRAGTYAIGEAIGVAGFALVLAALYLASASPGWILLSLVVWASGVVAVAVTAGVGPTRVKARSPSGLWPFAATATVGSFVSLGVAQATVLVMAAMHGSMQAGLLAAAVAITAPLFLLPRGLSLALTPAMSYHVGAEARERADLDTTYTTTLLVLFGGVATASIIALTDVALAAYGTEFSDAKTFVAVFAVASFIAISGIPVINRFASEGARALRLTAIASTIGALGAGWIWLALGENHPIWIAVGFLIASIVKVAIPFALSGRVMGRVTLPGLGVSLLTATAVAATFLPQPWPLVSVALLVLASLPVLFVATVRYRARAASLAVASQTAAPLTDQSRPFTIGVLTNMYPTPQLPHYGVSVKNRVTAYEALGAVTVTITPRRAAGISKYPLLALDALWALLRRPIPDVYEVHCIQPTALVGQCVAWLTERPYVLYAHGSDVTLTPKPGLYRSLIDRAVRGASEIHTNSRHTADLIHDRWGRTLVVLVIPPGVRMNEEKDSQHVRDIDVLYVGAMTRLEGVDVLIDSLTMIPSSLRSAVVLAGSGPDLPRLRAQAEEANVDAQFLGSVDPSDVPALMHRAKVLAVPSRGETLGQVAIEGLAAGTPVVVSDTGGLGSLPTDDCGSVVPPDDAEALAEALRDWLTEPPDALRAASLAARRRAERFAIGPLATEAVERFALIAHRHGAPLRGRDGLTSSSDTPGG